MPAGLAHDGVLSSGEAARDAVRARRHWVDVLRGEPAEGPADELILRWPRSPLRLVVEIDAGAPERPVALDLVTDLPVGGDEPHAVLGVTLRTVKDEAAGGTA